MNTLKSSVRFAVIGTVGVNRAHAYPAFAITSEVADDRLVALTVEIDHPTDWAVADIVEAARAKLRPLCSLIGIGTTAEPALGNAFVSNTSGESVGLGFANVQARAGIVRGLTSLPKEVLLSKLENDPRLARQADYLNSAWTAGDIVGKIRYGYKVLEQERAKHTGYQPPDNFRHVRDAVSHPELANPQLRAFLLANVGSEQLDLGNPAHMHFLEEQSKLLLDESRRIVESYLSPFW